MGRLRELCIIVRGLSACAVCVMSGVEILGEA